MASKASSQLKPGPAEWTWSTLERICAGVFDCQHSTPKLSDEGPLLARSQDIRAGIFRADQAARVSYETFLERIRRTEPRHGDILYSREGTYFGIAAEVPRDTQLCLGQRMVLIRPDSDYILSRYLRYWLNSPMITGYVRRHRDGSVAERLNLPAIRRTPVLLPSLDEQRAVAWILGTFDDKIELNRRMNQTMEALARAIFNSSFSDDQSGQLGNRWEVGALAAVASINERKISEDFKYENILYVDISSVSVGSLLEPKPYRLSEAPSRARHLVASGDTIWSSVRPNRRSYRFVHNPPQNMVVSTGFVVISPKKLPPSYLYFWLTRDAFVDYLESCAEGSAYPAVRPHVFSKAEVVIPPPELVDRFEAVVGPMLAKIAASESEGRVLATLRDALLPKLLSGEIRVKQAEKIAEKAL